MILDIKEIQKRLQEFADDRNWERYHSPKNLIMALSAEVGELVELFQWLTENESKKENLSEEFLNKSREELADIMIYVIRIADKLDIDLVAAISEKLKINEQKYPVDLAKNNAIKYNRRPK